MIQYITIHIVKLKICFVNNGFDSGLFDSVLTYPPPASVLTGLKRASSPARAVLRLVEARAALHVCVRPADQHDPGRFGVERDERPQVRGVE